MSNNVKVQVVADIADLRTKMVAAQAIVKESEKAFAAAAKVIANGDATEEARANVLKLTETVIEAKSSFNALQLEYAETVASVTVSTKAGAAFVASLRQEAEAAGLTRAQLLELKAARLGVGEQAAPFIATVTAGELTTGQRFIEQLREQVATARLSKAELLEYRAAQLGVETEAAPLIARLGELNSTQVRATGISGQQRFALMVVGEQLRQVSTEAALGISPMTIFAQQSGQTVQALSMVAGEGSALGAFLTSGWGIAAVTATAALAPLIAKLVETSGALADVGDAAQQAMAKLNQSLDRSSDFTKTATEASKKYVAGLQELAGAEQALKAAQESRAAGGAFNGPFAAGVARPDQDVTGAQARVDAAKKKIADARAELDDLREAQRIAELQQAAQAKLDAIGRPASRAAGTAAKARATTGDKAAARAAAEAERQQVQIDESAAQSNLAVQKSTITDRRQGANFDFEQAISATAVSAQINAAEQKRDVLKALANEEAQDEIAAQQARAAARAKDPVAAAEAADQIKVIEANLRTSLAQIDRQYTSDHEREVERRRQAERAAEAERLQAAQRTNAGILEVENQLVVGILSGRQTMGQVLASLALNVAQREIQADLQYFAERRLLQAEGISADRATSERGIVLQVLTGQRKVAAHAAAQAAETSVTAGSEAAKTAAVTTGVAARTATTAAGAATSAAIVGKHNLKEITSHAATAAAAAYHALAGIPVVGPFLGAAAAAATFTAVEAYGALASFDKGTNLVPNDMVAQIHAGERIIPAADNRELMAAVRGDTRASGDTHYHTHYAPTVNGQLPFAEQLAAHEDNIISIVQHANRRGTFRYA